MMLQNIHPYILPKVLARTYTTDASIIWTPYTVTNAFTFTSVALVNMKDLPHHGEAPFLGVSGQLVPRHVEGWAGRARRWAWTTRRSWWTSWGCHGRGHAPPQLQPHHGQALAHQGCGCDTPQTYMMFTFQCLNLN